MARTLPGGGTERTLLASGHVTFYAKLEIRDSDGTWRDLTNLSGSDWLESWRISESVDNPVAAATFVLRREIGALSLAPLVTASTINRNAALVYTPLVTAPRLVRFSVASVAPGVAPIAGDFHEIFQGPITQVDPAEQEESLTVKALDLGDLLQRTMIETVDPYGSGPGVAIQTVMQQIINAWITVAPPTLVTPVSPGFLILAYAQSRVNVLQALRDLALQVGGDTRFMYPAASNVPELRFFQPDRAKVVPDWTFAGSEYTRLPMDRIDDADIRNVCRINFIDSATGLPAFVTRLNSGSIAQFGRRYMEITEDAASNIDTAGEANTMGDGAVADLGSPLHEHEIETLFFWPIQLGDLCRFTANGVHYDTDQDLAVVEIVHQGAGGDASTTISCRGKPCGAYSDWIRGSKPGGGGTGGTDTGLQAPPPIPSIFYAGNRNSSEERVELIGRLGREDMGPLLWQTRIDQGAWSALSSIALPFIITVLRKRGYSQKLELRVQQADGQDGFASYTVPPYYPDGATIPRDDDARSGRGGLPVPRGRIIPDVLYSRDGTRPLIDTDVREILSDLGIGSGVKGASDVAFGAGPRFATNRHNERVTGGHGDSRTFGTSYEQIPSTRVIPQKYKAPTAGNTVVFEATAVSVSGCTLRAVEITGSSVTPRSDDFAATLNGTPVGAGIGIGAPNSVAFCNLSNANTTPTTYRAYFDVNTLSKVGGGLLRVTAYKNDGVSSTSWTQVGQKSYDDGMNISGEYIEFAAALAQNWDVRLVITYTAGTPSVNGSVTADRVDYDQVTGGSETSLTSGVAGAAIAVDAVEPS